jgi:nitrogen fixation NifU-like protein
LRHKDFYQLVRNDFRYIISADISIIFDTIIGRTKRISGLKQVSFTGAGCAISTASASLMTEALTGKTRAEAEAVSQDFRDLVTGKLRDTEDSETIDTSRLGKLCVLAGVQQFPVRVKCATLAWHTLEAALNEKKQAIVSTN